MRDHTEEIASFGTARAIFLSPHYDDAVLSCGGTIALLADQGCVPIVVTVFAGEVPDEMLTDFAKWKHSRWGVSGVEEIVLRRQEEDRDAIEALGARPYWLGYPDAIYRGDRYLSDPSLFGTPQAVEMGLVTLIADEIRSMPEWDDRGTVFVPLGIGEHVDHQIVFAVGRVLAARGVRVLAYEDCPYAMHTPAGVERRLAEIEGAVGPPVPVAIGTTLARRIEAISAYRSQVPVIFRFTTDVSGAVSDFARKIGGPLGPAERFWPVLGAVATTTTAAPGMRDDAWQDAPSMTPQRGRGTVQVVVDERMDAMAVVHLTGRLDALSAPHVRGALANEVAAGYSRLVVDLANVEFVDSSGLGSLISGLKVARTAGGDLRLAQPSTQVSALIALTTLGRILRSYPTVADALIGY